MSTFTFPSPVGGVSSNDDFAPSILFAVLFGLLVPITVFRYSKENSRTLILFGTFGSSAERIAIFALRAVQARNDEKRVSNSLTTYMQISWAVGFISLAGDLHRLLGCLLTNNMKPPGASIVLSDTEVNASSKHRSVSTHSDPVVQVTAVEQEKPKEHWFAGAFRLFALVVWAPLITGIISGSIYTKAEHDASKVNSVQHLRYTSTVLSFIYILALQSVSLWTAFSFRNHVRRGALLVAGLLTLLDVVCVYRLIVMRFHTTDLTSEASGSLNGGKSHALFYVFHIVPEFVVVATILSLNVREMFGTGLWEGLLGRKVVTRPSARV